MTPTELFAFITRQSATGARRIERLSARGMANHPGSSEIALRAEMLVALQIKRAMVFSGRNEA
jgi:hypothetical protein